MSAIAAADVEREAARRRLHSKRKLANAVALTLALGSDGLRPVLADLDPDRDRAARPGRHGHFAVHGNDAAAPGGDRRPRERDFRLGGDGDPGDAARHADRRARGDLPCGVRQGQLAGQHDPVHQRHPPVGAFDRDRAVHLLRGRRPPGQLLRIRRHSRPRPDRHSGRGPHHREHAGADPERLARGGLRPGDAEVARHHDRDVQGGARRRDHRRPAGASRASPAKRRRCCSRRCPTSSGPATSASRWRACR